MDASNRLADVILGKERALKASELSPEQWLAIIRGGMESLKTQMKYLPEFKPLAEWFKCGPPHSEHSGYHQFLNHQLTDFPVGMGEDTHCWFMALCRRGNVEEQILPARPAEKQLRQDSLFLTRENAWIRWNTVLGFDKCNEIGNSYQVRANVISSTLEFLSWNTGFMSILEPKVGKEILDTIAYRLERSEGNLRRHWIDRKRLARDFRRMCNTISME